MRSNAVDYDNARELARRIFFVGRKGVLNDLCVGSGGVVRRLVDNFWRGQQLFVLTSTPKMELLCLYLGILV